VQLTGSLALSSKAKSVISFTSALNNRLIVGYKMHHLSVSFRSVATVARKAAEPALESRQSRSGDGKVEEGGEDEPSRIQMFG
jgi:hypothetical protein